MRPAGSLTRPPSVGVIRAWSAESAITGPTTPLLVYVEGHSFADVRPLNIDVS